MSCWGGGNRAEAQVADHATSTLSPPGDGATYPDVFWYGVENQPSVYVAGTGAVFATGPANGSFDVDWNIWLKVDSVSVCANDTSSGQVTQTFDGSGNWHRSANLSGYWTGGVGTYQAESNATLTVYHNGSTTQGSKTDHNFIVYPVIYP